MDAAGHCKERAARCHRLVALVAAALLWIVHPLAAAETSLHPTWLTTDATGHRVAIDLVAGWNDVNDGLNFKGYAKGAMTVVVPVGWTVDLVFKNADKKMPHSVVVTKAYGEDDMPNVAGATAAALRHAYARNPTGGLFAPHGDTARFAANAAGDYDFFCGAPGHGRRGMWTRLTVDANTAAPYVTVTRGPLRDGREVPGGALAIRRVLDPDRQA
jgi:uncharacterized cupredoxin-like copper-binding protein